MGHHQRGGGAEFNRKIAIRDCIQRITADVVEAEGGRHALAIDRERGAGQCGGAQRQAVDALAAILHAFGVAPEHFHIGQYVMAEGDRLRYLHVGKAGQDGVGMLFRQIQQGQAQFAQQAADVVDGAAQVEADVGCDLVVARTAGMQAFAGIADQFGQAFFDVQVDVFQIQQPFKLAGVDFALDLAHAFLDGRIVVGADDFLICQHLGVGQRALDVDCGQALVEKYRGGVAFDQIRDRFGETSRPGFAFF